MENLNKRTGQPRVWTMSTRTILTIEDDEAIRRGIRDALSYFGFQVLEAGDGRAGREMALTTEYDLLLLDLALPAVPGLDILRQVRQARPTLLVIVLTAKGSEAHTDNTDSG